MDRLQTTIQQVKTLAFRLPFYHLSLKPPLHASISVMPHDPWPGNRDIGFQILSNVYEFEGHSYQGNTIPWNDPFLPQTWRNYAHSFHWLRDLRETSVETARRKARDMIMDWFEKNEKWDEFSWAGDRIAKRVYHLIALYDFYASSANETFINDVRRYIFQQIKHLLRLNFSTYQGNRQVTIIRGILYGLFNLPESKRLITSYEKRLFKITASLLTADGFHQSRNPTHHVELMRLLIDIKYLYQASNRAIPVQLNQTLKQMAPYLKFLMSQDGGLFLFQGSWEQDKDFLTTLQTHLDHKVKFQKSFPRSGYERIAAGKSLLFVDVGIPPESPFDHWAHAGTFAFEFSSNKQRLIVNCGHPQNSHDHWDRLLATTAAHSTLTLEDTNSSEVLAKGLGKKPSDIAHYVDQEENRISLSMSHDGYMFNHKTRHRRLFHLSENGQVLSGEDILEGPTGKEFAIRFHLHPKVKLSLIQESKAVLLQLPSGSGWKMSAHGEELTIEPSIYFGDGKNAVSTKQIVIKGVTAPNPENRAQIKWLFEMI